MRRISVTALVVVTTALLVPGLVHSEEVGRCSEPPKIIEPVKSGPQFKAFRRWLNAHEAADVDHAALNLASGDFGEYLAYWGLYIADINNDGTDEYVFPVESGNHLAVFSKSGDGFQLDANDAPPKPRGEPYDGPLFLSGSMNPLTEKSELFVRVCGKVYISEGYLWEKGETTAACDRNWIEYNRAIFRQVYDAHYYGRAVEFMTGIVDQCGNRIEAKQRGWIYNDLALTWFRLGDRQRCLDYLGKARVEKEATAANPSLGKAISYNEALCKSKSALSTQDFGWLLNPALSETDQVVSQSHFDDLLLSIMPDFEGSVSELRLLVKEDFDGLGDVKRVSRNRFVTISACRMHDCGSLAMLWVDTQEKVGIFVINHLPSLCQVAIGSRNIAMTQIPKEFWGAFQAWKLEHGSEGCTVFVGADGKIEPISPPQ